MSFLINYRIFSDDITHDGSYLVPSNEDAREFIEYAKKWYGKKIIFTKIKELSE